MYKKLGIGFLMCVLAITMVLVMPADAQATKKTKKKPKATIEEDYQSPDNNYLIGQKGVLKKFPEKLDVKRVIKNRNKKAKYTFYAADKKKLTISRSGKITAIKGYKDGEIVKIIVKETYKKKTRKVGVIKYTATFPKIMDKKVTWYVGHSYYAPSEWWMTKMSNKEDLPFYVPGAYTFSCDDEPWTKEDITKTVKELNGEIEDDSDEEDTIEDPFEWDAEWQSLTVKDAGHLYFTLYALNYSTNKYYYVGQFDAELIKWTQVDDISINPLSAYDWATDHIAYCMIGQDDDIQYSFTPEYYYGELIVTSSDPSVATVAYNKDEQCYTVHGLKSGTVTITFDANGFQKKVEYRILSKKEYNAIIDQKISELGQK